MKGCGPSSFRDVSIANPLDKELIAVLLVLNSDTMFINDCYRKTNARRLSKFFQHKYILLQTSIFGRLNLENEN